MTIRIRRQLRRLSFEEYDRLDILKCMLMHLIRHATEVARDPNGYCTVDLANYNGKSLVLKAKWGVETSHHTKVYRLPRTMLENNQLVRPMKMEAIVVVTADLIDVLKEQF